MDLKKYSKRTFKRSLLYLYIFTLFTYPIAILKPKIMNRPLPIYIIFLYIILFITIYDWKPVKIKYLSSTTKIIWGFWSIVLIVSVISLYDDALRFGPTMIALSYILIPVVFSDIIADERMLQKVICILSISLFLMVIYGYYGFLTHRTGQYEEHQLFYWGIRYTVSTRNSDVLFPILLAYFILSFLGFRKTELSTKLFLLIILILSITAVILSQSRSGWFAFLFGSAFITMLWIKEKKSKKTYQNVFALYLIFFIGAILGILLLNIVSEDIKTLLSHRLKSIFSLSTEFQVSNIERLKIIESALLQIIRNPIGIGWGNAIHYLTVDGTPHHAENAYLNVLVETGWIGFGCFLYMVFFPLKYNWSCMKHDQSIRWYHLFIVSENIMISVYFLFNTAVYNICIWILIGLNICSINIRRKKQTMQAKNW